MTWSIRSFAFIGRTVILTLKSWDSGIMWSDVSWCWRCIFNAKERLRVDFLKNNRTDTPKKEGVVKRNNPFATMINWQSRYRESKPISLVQLRLLQGSQKKARASVLFSVIFALRRVLLLRSDIRLRRVVFASRVWETNIISLRNEVKQYHFCASKNITLTKSAYH